MQTLAPTKAGVCPVCGSFQILRRNSQLSDSPAANEYARQLPFLSGELDYVIAPHRLRFEESNAADSGLCPGSDELPLG